MASETGVEVALLVAGHANAATAAEAKRRSSDFDAVERRGAVAIFDTQACQAHPGLRGNQAFVADGSDCAGGASARLGAGRQGVALGCLVLRADRVSVAAVFCLANSALIRGWRSAAEPVRADLRRGTGALGAGRDDLVVAEPVAKLREVAVLAGGAVTLRCAPDGAQAVETELIGRAPVRVAARHPGAPGAGVDGSSAPSRP